MAKRKGGRRLSRAARLAYERGRRAGLKAAAKKRSAQAKAAGRKGAQIRAERRAAGLPPRGKPTAGLGIPELVLYKSGEDDAAPAFQPLTDWPVEPSEWVAELLQLSHGRVVAREDVTLPADWERSGGSVATDLRRAWRMWHEIQKTEHPELDESPALGVKSLRLRKVGAL